MKLIESRLVFRGWHGRGLVLSARNALILAVGVSAASSFDLALAQVAVTEGGTPAYSLPIAVPPGISGMSPNIGLSYAGAGVNGPVGHGWSIQGVSLITRCPQTRAIDGFSRGVSFSADDKLCLDGQRLIQTDANGIVVNGNVTNPGPGNVFQSADSVGGASGSAVREYRTEKDTYVRVRAYGSAGGVAANGPAYFKVWTKSGQIYEYGNNGNATANAAINAQGKPAIAAWAVSRISDTLGNYIDFQYEQRDVAWGSGPTIGGSPAAGHEWNLLEIRYTGTSSQPPANKVVFSYDDRPATATSGPPQDRAEAYAQGSKNVSIRRLTAIRTYVNSPNPGTLGPGGSAVKVKTVKLTYDNGPITNRSRVTRIVECAGAAETACLPPTVFSYAAGGIDAFQPNAQFAASPVSTLPMTVATGTYGVLPIDFNADGKTDLLRWSDTPSDNQLYRSNGDGNFYSVGNFNLTSQNLFKSDGCFTSLPIDINGDGLVDLLRYSSATNISGNACASPPPSLLLMNNGDGTFTSTTYSGPALARTVSRKVVCTAKQRQLGICYSDGWTAGAMFFLMDFDGDGIPDLVTTRLPARAVAEEDLDTDPCYGQVCTRVYKGNGSGAFVEVPTNISDRSLYIDGLKAGASLDSPRNLVDLDGDGLVDIVGVTGRYTGAATAFRSRGDGNFDVASGAPCTYPLDFNGDGRNDCLSPDANGTAALNRVYSTNGGTGTLSFVGNFNLTAVGDTLTAADAGIAIVDINGDGRHDILRWKNDPAQARLYLSNGDGTFAPSGTFNLTGTTNQLKSSDYGTDFVVGDFTGRGNTEILRLKASPTPGEATSNQLYEKVDQTQPDQLISVTSPSGLTTTLTWVPLTNSMAGSLGARYVSDRGVAGQAASYPKIDIAPPAYVVATSQSATGVGASTLTTEYSYKGLKAAFDGRGARGFRETRRQSTAPNGSDLTVVTQYLQDQPYIGVASGTQTYVGTLASTPGNLLSKTTNVYCDKTAAGGAEASAVSSGVPCPVTAKVQRPYLVKTTEEGWDPTTYTALPTVTTRNDFNSNLDPNSIVVTTAGTALGVAQTFTKTTTNSYFPDNTAGDAWILGRLQQATQTNVAPNSLASIATSAGTAPGASATQGSGQTQFASLANLSFGNVTATASSTLSSTLANTGALPLTITVPAAGSVSGAGFSFASTTCGTVLAAYASCTVTVTFAPAAGSAYSGSLTVATGAGTLTATLTGTGVGPAVAFEPVSTNWGVIGASSDSGDWLQIRNNGAVAVLITAHSPVSGPAGVWSWQGQSGFCIPGTTVLQPGATCQTFFGMTTAATPGAYTAVDQISYQVVGGNGATFTTQQTYAFSIATTTANTGGLSFGNVSVNTTSATQSFTLTNNAVNGGSVKNLAISMIGNQPGNFPMSHNCGGAIAAGASCTVTISFNPTWIANGFSAAVQIQGSYSRIQGGVDTGYNCCTGVNFTVPVSGNGSGSIATVTNGPLDFGTTTQYATQQVRFVNIRNDGNAPLTLGSAWANLPAAVTVPTNTCSGTAPGATCSMEMRMATTSPVSFNQAISTSGATTNATLNASGVVTAAPALTASIVGADLANDVYRSTVTAYPSGGVAPYTYSWTKVSGQLNITGTTTASSVATTTNFYCGVYTARLQVVITDSVGNQITRQGDAAIERYAPPGKPSDFCNSLTTPPPAETSMHHEPPAVRYALAGRVGS